MRTPEEQIQSLEKKNQRISRDNSRLKKEVQDLLVIGEVARSITSSFKIEEILRSVLTGIKNVLGMEKVLLSLVNLDEGIEEVKVAVGTEVGELKKGRWEIRENGRVWRDLKENGMPLLIDPSKESSLPEFVKETFEDSFVKVPIVAKQEIVGTIMSYRSGRKLSQRDLRILKIFAEYAAVAIENGRLYYDVIKSEEELRETQNQLIEAEKLAVIGQVAVSINHEINNPLNNISLITQTVLRKSGNNGPELASLMKEIEQNVERIQTVARKTAELKSTASTEYLPNQLMINLA